MERKNFFWFFAGLLIIVAGGLIVSCGGGGGGSNNNNGNPTYTLSGSVTGAGKQGVTITVSSAGTATTNASGAYSMSGLANGYYTVTASKPGYAFTPASQVVAINYANAVATSFVSAQLYNISGNVVDGSTVATPGVTMTLSATGLASDVTATTDGIGNYIFGNILATGDSYTITPVKAPVNDAVHHTLTTYAFSPANLTGTAAAADVIANFVVSATTTTSYSLSGAVTDGSSLAMPGVVMTLSSAGLSSDVTTTTDGSGNYMFEGMLLSGASYTIRPAKSPVYDVVSVPHTVTTYTFGPANFTGTISAADVIGANFVTYASTTTAYSVSGRIVSGTNTSLGPQPFILSGVAVRLSDPAYVNTIIALTDGSGNYSFDAVANGSYILWVAHFDTGHCPSPTLYSFVVSSPSVTVNGANVAIGDITENVSRDGCAHPTKPDLLSP